MKITIQLHTQEEFSWIAPFIQALSAQVSLQIQHWDDPRQVQKINFLNFIDQHQISVSSIKIPSRDERNER